MAYRFSKIAATAVTALITFTATASAGGFGNGFGAPMGGGVSAKALANNYAHVSSASGQVRTNNYAKVGQYSINNGEILKGFAEAGNRVDIEVTGNIKVNQKSTART
ncbi:MAG: hypothetical protein ACRBBN_20270, partial [Methyloligellaceae bacterium]